MGSGPLEHGMTDWHRQFGELRSILHGAPSASAWSQLCAVLEAQTGCAKRMSQHILPYTLMQLKSWPDALRVCPRRWLEDRAYTWALMSVVRRVNLARAGLDDQALGRVLSKPPLASVRTLDIRHNWVRAQGAHHVATNSALGNLTHVLLGYNQISDQGAQSILESRRLLKLTHLDLTRNGLSDSALAHMPPECDMAQGLHAFNVSHNWLGVPGAAHVGRQRWPRLTWLNVRANALGDAGCARLFERPDHFPALEHIDLGHNNLGPRSAKTLAWHMPQAGVDTLILQDNRLGKRGLYHLVESTRMRQVRVLDVRRNQIPSDGMSAFEDLTHMRNLEGVLLDDNLLDARAIQAMHNAPSLQRLRTLGLGRNALGDDAVEALCALPCVEHLRVLNLEHNRLGRDGCVALARAPFRHLHHLNVRANGLTPQDLHILKRAPWFEGLNVLKVG